MSIPNSQDKIKSKEALADIETVKFNDQGEIVDNSVTKKFFLFFVLILLLTLSFGLGRLSNKDSRGETKIMFENNLTSPSTSEAIPPKEVSVQTLSIPSTDQTVVASVKGTKYHYLDCPGAKQIAAANKITFKNPDAAKAAGYSLALNCKPR